MLYHAICTGKNITGAVEQLRYKIRKMLHKFRNAQQLLLRKMLYIYFIPNYSKLYYRLQYMYINPANNMNKAMILVKKVATVQRGPLAREN